MTTESNIDRDYCVAEVPNYGPCGRPEGHLVHLGGGISFVEHVFEPRRFFTGEMETMKLSKRNMRRISKRSGRSMQDLEIMRQAAKRIGSGTLKVTYKVVQE